MSSPIPCLSLAQRMVLLILLIFCTGCQEKGGTEQGPRITEQGRLNFEKNGKELRIDAYIPRGITQFELRIKSDRNRPITRTTTISPYDVDSVYRKERYSSTEIEIWYPVVDVKPEQGMDAVCIFKGDPTGTYIFGSPFYREQKEIAKEIILPSNKLEWWENSLTVESREYEIESFYLRKTYPVLLREFKHTLELLSEEWSGKISIFAMDQTEMVEIASGTVPPARTEWRHAELEAYKGSGISRDRLIVALQALIDDGIRRQNNNPSSPMYGTLHLFYDLDARLHRTSFWTWGSSQYVKMTLDALGIPEIRESNDTGMLMDVVEKIGRVYLRYQVREEGHPSNGSFLVIWSRGYRGYTKWVGTSDSGVIIRWALMPLFKATGDSTYLEAAEYWCSRKREMLDTVEILPHYYKYDEDLFASGILDETGWDPEGHAALFEVTGNEAFRASGKQFMDKHMKVFQREDGLWQRSHNWETGRTQETARMVRGLGWAMEGLLAMNRMYPDTIYLEYATRMADQLVEHQHPDGSWSFVFNLPPEAKGITEKGTALWSLLLYQLHQATGDSNYLDAARKALLWCLENQYTGPDPEAIGGLVGRTNASMVGIRYFYDATCAYTTGFFGLAILEELKLVN